MANLSCRIRNALFGLTDLPPWRALLRWLVGALWLTALAAQAAPFAYLAERLQKTVSVVDMATYTTTAVIAMENAASSPVEVVASEATGTVWVAHTNGISFIDSASNTVTGSLVLPEMRAMVVSPDGQKVYALRPGSLSVIDAASKVVIATLAVDPSAVSMAIDKDGETVYVAHSGYSITSGAVAGITIVDGLTNEVDRVIPTGAFSPILLAVNPGDDRLYMMGYLNSLQDPRAYTVFDPATLAITRVAFTVPSQIPVIYNLSSIAFNADGSRLYVGGNTSDEGIDSASRVVPVLEIDTASGMVSRVLSLPNALGTDHLVVKLATSFASGKFVMAVFISERMPRTPYIPAPRVMFVDVASGTVLNEFKVPDSPGGDFFIGDILDPATPPATGQRQPTTTALQASVSAPLSRNLPVSFIATVSGNQPGGKVVFRFVSRDGRKRVEKVPVALAGGMATLALPACTERVWSSRVLRRIVCGDEFKVVAVFKGDALNARSKSEPLHENR